MQFYSHLSDDERDQIAILRAAGAIDGGSLPGRSVGRKQPSPGSCSGTNSPRAGIPRFTPPEPTKCAGGVKRSSTTPPCMGISVSSFTTYDCSPVVEAVLIHPRGARCRARLSRRNLVFG